MLRVLCSTLIAVVAATVFSSPTKTAFAQAAVAAPEIQAADNAASPTQSDDQPRTLTEIFIDDRQVNAFLRQQGLLLRDEDDAVPASTLKEQLGSVGERLAVELPEVVQDPTTAPLKHSYHSSLIIANLYDCGRCDKIHTGSAGAVALSSDGLVLTNHHVINSPNKTFNYFVMTHDGDVFPVIEVVATNKQADLAIIRVDADNLTPARLATQQPEPMDPLYVISHPHGRFFSLSTGLVSRFSRLPGSDGKGQNWMEITARFSQGSSGSGVFNQAGELIGLVSRKDSIFNKGKDGSKELAFTIFKSVPLSEIKAAAGITE